MKMHAIAVVVVVCGLVAAIAVSQDTPFTTDSHASLTVPRSLEGLYLPKNQVPAYLLEMQRLSQPLSGIACDVMEGDLPNVQKHFEAFAVQYARVAALVPEWADRYPALPVDALGKAIAGNDPGQIMGAMQGVGQVCHSCHIATMAPVQQRYSWPSFGAVSLTDPLSKSDVNFAQLMQMMESNFTGMAVDLEQGQMENAQRQLQGFRARFSAMAQSCDACHDTERKYFVSPDVTGLFDDLDKALGAETVDGVEVGQLMQTIGQESCRKCHLVHVPAAYAQSHMTDM